MGYPPQGAPSATTKLLLEHTTAELATKFDGAEVGIAASYLEKGDEVGLITALIASIFDNASLTAAKGASIFDHANLTVAKAESILEHANLSYSKRKSIRVSITRFFHFWLTAPNLGTAREFLAGCGTQTAGLSFGGYAAANSAVTEEYDGAAWAAGGALGTARQRLAGCGTQTAGLSFGGYVTANSAVTEEYW